MIVPLLALAPTLMVGAMSCPNPLPVEYRADGGIPVAVDDGYVWLYGDTFKPAGGMVHNTVVMSRSGGVGSETALNVFTSALTGTADTWYWPSDAVQLPDGPLLVLAGEIESTGGDGFWDFRSVDTDAFIVSDPFNLMSWKLATKVDDGPWGHGRVEFLDQEPVAAVQQPGSYETELYVYDPADITAPWQSFESDLPQSFGPFTPVQTDKGWWGVSWVINDVALWHADDPTGTWEWADGWHADGLTYGHGLNIVNGQVVYRWSNAQGSQRVQYRVLDL